jgi:hypothetical protein
MFRLMPAGGWFHAHGGSVTVFVAPKKNYKKCAQKGKGKEKERGGFRFHSLLYTSCSIAFDSLIAITPSVPQFNRHLS